MNAPGVQHSQTTPHVGNGPDVVMIDHSRHPEPAPQQPRVAASVPPPSTLEPPSVYQQRAQSHPTGNPREGPATGPKLPAMLPPTPQQPHQQQREASQPQRAAQPGQHSNTRDLPSPEGRRDFQTADQYTALASLIKNSDQAIVRQVLRDHWGHCFVGSEYHTAFVLNTTLHQATPATLNRAITDFGAKMVLNCKVAIMQHFTAEDYDEVANVIFPNVSTKFLDRALALRVETIEAKSLVNILGRAERLGYSIDDIVEEHPASNGIGKTEQVIPSMKGVPLDNIQQPPPQQLPPPQHEGVLTMQQLSQGLVQCGACKRPCSGPEALNYHSKKAACDPNFDLKGIGRSICPHCGCTFGSNGGCSYHLKSQVCGTFSEEVTDAMHHALQAYVQNRPPQSQSWAQAGAPMGVKKVALPRHPPSAQHQPSPIPLSSSTPQASQGESPYDHLSTESLARFRQEIADAEEVYGKKMRDAMLLPEPESTDKLSRHKNAYNAKISTTRKRYGIRLRERRSKEEVDAERVRLLQRPDAPELWLEQERAMRELEKSGKRLFDGPGGPGTSASFSGTPSQTQRPQSNGQTPVDSPRKRVPLSEMGGLSGSAGSAEVVDPTAYQAPSSQSRSFVQMQQQQPAGQMSRAAQGTNGNPMAVDSNSNSDTVHSQEETDSETESSEDDSDEDIPAE